MPASRPSRPALQHLVLNVRDIEASHRFYTEALGFEQSGTFEAPGGRPIDMRFYRGQGDHHHDIALVQIRDPESAPEVPKFSLFSKQPGLAHLALCYEDRDAWLAQLEHLQNLGVEFKLRGNHGMTHSAYVADPDGNGVEVLYDLPPEVWQGDVNAALSYFEPLPTTGPEALEDSTDYVTFPRA
jgi:catechol 2,3-dioxygenase